MPRKGAGSASAWGKIHREYIARLKKLGAVFCPTCFAYLAPTHDCDAFRPVYLPAPLEAYAFAAEGRND